MGTGTILKASVRCAVASVRNMQTQALAMDFRSGSLLPIGSYPPYQNDRPEFITHAHETEMTDLGIFGKNI